MRYKLSANWKAPTNIQAFTTTREGGESKTPYTSNNLGTHVGDNLDDVEHNRNKLITRFELPSTPFWLNQTHSTHCVLAEADGSRDADAAITRTPNRVLAIMTADCLPILLCNKAGNEVAAIHAGWQGLLNGVVENTLAQMESTTNELIAWIGPSICQACYEVGQEVYEQFTSVHNFSKIAL